MQSFNQISYKRFTFCYIEDLQVELTDAKSKFLVIEEKERNIKAQEGIYINEINDLKRVNNRYQLFNKGLITVIIVLLIVIIGYITFTIGVNNSNSTVREIRTTESTKNEQMQPAPAPVKK